MIYKFYTSGKYFYIENTTTQDIQESSLEDAFIFKTQNESELAFYVKGTNIEPKLYKFLDIVDKDEVPFADETAFKSFYENFKTGGGSPQPPVIDDATPTKKGVAKMYNGTGQNTDGSLDQKTLSDLFQNLRGQITDITFPNVYGGSINLTSIPTGTGGVFWSTLISGVYVNFGSVVVLPNNFAFISRSNLGVFSVTQTPIIIDKFSNKITRNLVDLTFLTDGYLSATGTIAGTNATAKTTDFLPITNGDTINSLINTAGVFGSCLYDVNKVFLQKIDMTNSKVIANVNAKFIRAVYFPIANFANDFTKTIVKNQPFPTNLIPFNSEVEIVLPQDKISINEVFVKQNETNLIKLSNYLKSGVSVSNTTGLEVASGSGSSSWFLPVNANVIYNTNGILTNFGAFYDENKIFISGITSANINETNFYFTNPNIKFLRIYFASTVTNHFLHERVFIENAKINLKNYSISTLNQKSAIDKIFLESQPLFGMKWNALGDSITVGRSYNTTSVSYVLKISEKYNIYARNYGRNGSRIMFTNDVDGPFAMSRRYLAMDDDADIVTVMGGTNDMNNNLPLGTLTDITDATFFGAIDVLCKGLKIKYPNKKIGFITPFDYKNINHLPYFNAMIQVCNKNIIPILDMRKAPDLITAQTGYFPDTLHPNSEAHSVYSSYIFEFLKTL